MAYIFLTCIIPIKIRRYYLIFCDPQLGKRNHSRLFFHVITDHFFHPHHIVPAAKFIAALMEFPDHGIAKMFMELDAVSGKIFIIHLGTGNAGIEIGDILGFQHFFKGSIKGFSHAGTLLILIYVDGSFHCPLVGCTGMKRAGIGVSYDPASPFGYQIRILLQSMKDPLAKFVQRWDFIFKGDSCMLHIRCLDAKKSRGIFGRSGTDDKFI